MKEVERRKHQEEAMVIYKVQQAHINQQVREARKEVVQVGPLGPFEVTWGILIKINLIYIRSLCLSPWGPRGLHVSTVAGMGTCVCGHPWERALLV